MAAGEGQEIVNPDSLIIVVLHMLKHPPDLHCVPIEQTGEQLYPAIHQFGGKLPARSLAKWMPPSMKQVFKNFNGANLFRPTDEASVGFVFFDVEEIAQEQIDFQDEFADDVEPGECDAEERAWMAGLIPVAAPLFSGDRFAIDTYHRRADGECRVVSIDHELRYGGPLSYSDVEEIAASYLEFFSMILNDPLTYITRQWRDEVTGQYWQIAGLVSPENLVTRLPGKDVD